jgi:hypothetical protein
MLREKPVMGADDFLLLMHHHWASDTNCYPLGHNRLDMALAPIFGISSGCRPASLMRTQKHENLSECDSGYGSSLDMDRDDSSNEESDQESSGESDDESGTNLRESGSDLKTACSKNGKDRADHENIKAIRYRDVRILAIRNKDPLKRDTIVLEVYLRHSKGDDRQPKP